MVLLQEWTVGLRERARNFLAGGGRSMAKLRAAPSVVREMWEAGKGGEKRVIF
jgi:hypothetical protein